MRTRMVSAWRLARRRDIVSRPPEKILSTATAEPRDMFEKVTCMKPTTHQVYTGCREPCRKGLETELVGQTTNELGYTRRNLQQGA